MLFDLDIIKLIKKGKMKVRNENGELLSLDFLNKHSMIQTGSLDVRLNKIFAIHKENFLSYNKSSNGNVFTSDKVMDPLKISKEDYEFQEIGMGEEFIMPPFSFCLAGTMESVELPNNICYVVDGKSTMGRLGVTVHITAGYADAGFKQQITLEMFNTNSFPIILRPGMFVAQFRFIKSNSGKDALNPYNGNYVKQTATEIPKTGKLFRYLRDLFPEKFNK